MSVGLLAGCGGGGGGSGDSGPVASSAQFSLDAATVKVLTTGTTLNGTAVDGADTWSISLSVTPASDATFEGTTRKQASQSLTIKKNGATVAAESYSQFFSVSPLVVFGAVYSDGTYGVVTVHSGNLPTAATVGSSGPLETLTLYSNSSKASVLETEQTTWTIEADTATTAWGCTNSVVRDTGNQVTATGAGCFKIDTTGNVLGMRYTISVSGKTLTFQ
jgi:hypothetical protein